MGVVSWVLFHVSCVPLWLIRRYGRHEWIVFSDERSFVVINVRLISVSWSQNICVLYRICVIVIHS